jgi:twitching motility protein PilT
MSAPLPLTGRIAVQLKLITPDQLAQATRAQAKAPEKQIGQLLIELGFLTEAQLQQVLRARQQVVAKQKAREAVAAADPVPEVAAAPAAKPAPPRPAAAPVPAPPSAAPAAAVPVSKIPTRKIELGPRDPSELIEVLKLGVSRGASDVHIHAGTPLRLRLHGQFVAADDRPIEPARAERMVRSALTDEQLKLFEERREIDFAYSVPNLGRFRVNLFRQQRGYDGVFRCIPAQVPSLEQLGLPSSLAKFTNFHQGLVLVTGPANCGKSSTLAALVDLVNEERHEHILTVEDPIEYLHPSKRCVVNQRNVGPHTESFARALRAALREDPDVIVIGELRDLETISLALTAAETGHLVLGTLHTNSAIRTLNRLIGVFPADQQDQVRNMVSESLRAIVSQRLVPAADGSRRVPALEVLVNNKAVGNLIRENKTFQIHSALQTGAAQGMRLLDHSLRELVQSGAVLRETALRHCDDPKVLGG